MARSIKGEDCGEKDFNTFFTFCILVSTTVLSDLAYIKEMLLCSNSRESPGFPRSVLLGVVPLVGHLPTEELDSVSPLVLWLILDGDNIEYYPHRWIGLWMEEEDRLLSRVLQVCHRAIQRPFLASGDLSQVGLSIYAVVVR